MRKRKRTKRLRPTPMYVIARDRECALTGQRKGGSVWAVRVPALGSRPTRVPARDADRVRKFISIMEDVREANAKGEPLTPFPPTAPPPTAAQKAAAAEAHRRALESDQKAELALKKALAKRTKNDMENARERERAFWATPRGHRNLGSGLTFEGLPLVPAHPVGYIYRNVSSFVDAVRFWRALKPNSRLLRDFAPTDSVERERRKEEFKKLKRRYAKTILNALGTRGGGYTAAKNVMDEWCAAARSKAGLVTGTEGGLRLQFYPLMATVWETNRVLLPLLEAYRDPGSFFRDLAPRLFPREFDVKPDDWQGLATLIENWGATNVLVNRKAHAALVAVSLSPRNFAELSARIERKKAYNDGPPLGATTGKLKANHQSRRDVYEAFLRIRRGGGAQERGEADRGLVGNDLANEILDADNFDNDELLALDFTAQHFSRASETIARSLKKTAAS